MMTPRRATLSRLIACLALVLGLVGSAAACSSDSPTAASQVVDTTVTTVAADPYEVVVATARGAELEVRADTPPGVQDTSPSTTTPVSDLGAIPRDDLNSAGSRTTEEGWAFENPTYFGNPLVVPVVSSHGDWLKVMVPTRPNGMQGWVRAADVELSSHRYRMELNLAAYELTVYDGEDVIERTDVVIGKDATYTPVGRFYINEKVEQSNPGGAYGPWVLSTNGYSESLETFDGGLPVIAFHGTNQPELIGTKASNGCIRMANDVVTRLAELLPAGTPVDIVAG